MFHSSYTFIISGMTDTGTVRSNNEDAFLLYNLERDEKLRPGGSESSTDGKGSLIIVSDGMGGANAGEVASNIAIQTLIEEIKNHCPEDPAKASQSTLRVLEDAIQCAHDNILKASLDDPDKHGMGATLTILWLARDKAWLGQVGDSRLYRLTQKEILQLSKDQTPVGHMLRSGEITAEEARTHPQRNLLDQALGAGMSSVHPHCEELRILESDCFLLCTDGLSDALTDHSIYNLVAKQARWSIPTACKYLINEANEAYGQDNITVVLCRIMKKS